MEALVDAALAECVLLDGVVDGHAVQPVLHIVCVRDPPFGWYDLGEMKGQGRQTPGERECLRGQGLTLTMP